MVRFHCLQISKNIIILTYTASFVNEFKQKIPRKVHINTASLEEKEAFKKRILQILVDKQQQQQQLQEQDAAGFTVVSLDESFFFYDSLVRKVWIDESNRPIVRVTGSHQRSCVFGAISMRKEKASIQAVR